MSNRYFALHPYVGSKIYCPMRIVQRHRRDWSTATNQETGRHDDPSASGSSVRNCLGGRACYTNEKNHLSKPLQSLLPELGRDMTK
jgi:hypothetical protein